MEENINNTEVLRNTIEDIVSTNYSQPILYLKKAPNAEMIKEMISNNNGIMLHTSPIAASNNINGITLSKLANSKDNFSIVDAVNIGKWHFDTNQCLIAIEEFSNYIEQNTMIAFCTMIDYTGPIYKSIMDYLPIKTYVNDTLKDGRITEFLRNYFFNTDKNSFGWLFNTELNPDINQNDAMLRINSANGIIANQLDQIIYTGICSSCDRAITEVLLGTRVSPNKSYVVDAACKYYGIKNTGIETAHEVYYRLNLDFVSLADKLMKSVVCPMVAQVFINDLFTNLFYVFQMHYDTNKEMENNNVVYNNEDFNMPEPNYKFNNDKLF